VCDFLNEIIEEAWWALTVETIPLIKCFFLINFDDNNMVVMKLLIIKFLIKLVKCADSIILRNIVKKILRRKSIQNNVEDRFLNFVP